MGNLNKLDFDITGETFPQEDNVKFIDISNKKEEPVTAETEEDKYISFSADLIKCFKDKVKKSPARLRVDSLVDTYKIAEETYSKSMNCTLGEWCMANVNRFLNIAEGKEFNLDSMANIDAAKEDKMLASEVDRTNYFRMVAKTELQKQFFETELQEVKIGYERLK